MGHNLMQSHHWYCMDGSPLFQFSLPPNTAHQKRNIMMIGQAVLVSHSHGKDTHFNDWNWSEWRERERNWKEPLSHPRNSKASALSSNQKRGQNEDSLSKLLCYRRKRSILLYSIHFHTLILYLHI